ncbi:hypothetical protein GCK32_001043 [Trichostrongylus colubriformis]|uniref:Uncharacterized protein n=1 Tax=Trichostrongylus colubriformis TaxID=6319 RepID=A0AAN8ILJ1_TRICO
MILLERGFRSIREERFLEKVNNWSRQQCCVRVCGRRTTKQNELNSTIAVFIWSCMIMFESTRTKISYHECSLHAWCLIDFALRHERMR